MKQFYEQRFVCTMHPCCICPFSDSFRSYQIGEKFEYNYIENEEHMRQSLQDFNGIMELIKRKFDNYYSELQRNRVPRVIIRGIFSNIANYVLRNETGSHNIIKKISLFYETFFILNHISY